MVGPSGLRTTCLNPKKRKGPKTEVEHANHYTTVPNAIYRINVTANKCELLSVPEIKYQIIHVAPVGLFL